MAKKEQELSIREKIEKAQGKAITETTLREAGLTRVPVAPDGAVSEKVLLAFVEAGVPEDLFFLFEGKQYKVFALAGWTAYQGQGKRARWGYDPITGDALTEAKAAQWAGFAPVCTFDGIVSMRDLIAYAAETGHMAGQEVTGPFYTMLLSLLPKGSTPVEPPTFLAEAANEWPYDPNASAIAARRNRQGKGNATSPSPSFAPAPPTVQKVVYHDGFPDDLQPTDSDRASLEVYGLFTSLFQGRSELSLFLSRAFKSDLTNALPDGGCSFTYYASQAAQAMGRRGMITPSLFYNLETEIPGRARDIRDALYRVFPGLALHRLLPGLKA